MRCCINTSTLVTLTPTSDKETLKVTSNTSLLVTVSVTIEMEMTTMQYKRGFKLVSVADDNTYWSWGPPISGAVEYKIGEWTVPLPENGPLALFDNMDNLLRFFDPYEWKYDRVFEVEYISSTERVLWVDPKYMYLPETEKVMKVGLSAGTVLASQIRLLQEIQVR